MLYFGGGVDWPIKFLVRPLPLRLMKQLKSSFLRHGSTWLAVENHLLLSLNQKNQSFLKWQKRHCFDIQTLSGTWRTSSKEQFDKLLKEIQKEIDPMISTKDNKGLAGIVDEEVQESSVPTKANVKTPAAAGASAGK